MWFVLRLLTLVGVYLWRFLWRQQGYDAAEFYNGVRYARKIVTGKNDKFEKAYHGIEYAGQLHFQFSQEKGWDRFFKDLGLAVEQQTGDEYFDEEIYITCDQPALGEMLRTNEKARGTIVPLFRAGAKRVFSDGAFVWAEFHNEAHLTETAQQSLFGLRAGLLDIPAADQPSRRDRFFWKAVAVESLAWSIACYGVPGFVQYLVERNTLYFEAWPVFRDGLLWSLAVFMALFAIIVILLRGSSRGHRIIIESFLVLLVGVPLSTVQAVSDINIELDQTPPILTESKVVAKTIEVKRSRRSRTTYYYLHLQSVTAGPRAVAGRIAVESSLYSAAREGHTVTLTLRDGKLGYPWLQDIKPE